LTHIRLTCFRASRLGAGPRKESGGPAPDGPLPGPFHLQPPPPTHHRGGGACLGDKLNGRWTQPWEHWDIKLCAQKWMHGSDSWAKRDWEDRVSPLLQVEPFPLGSDGSATGVYPLPPPARPPPPHPRSLGVEGVDDKVEPVEECVPIPRVLDVPVVRRDRRGRAPAHGLGTRRQGDPTPTCVWKTVGVKKLRKDAVAKFMPTRTI